MRYPNGQMLSDVSDVRSQGAKLIEPGIPLGSAVDPTMSHEDSRLKPFVHEVTATLKILMKPLIK